MSDSGFSGLPPGARTGPDSFPQSLLELKAKVIALRGELKATQVKLKLEGEILRHNPDGSTRIRTDKGEVTVELRGKDIPPEGAKVEVEIPRGNPPQQVIVRPAPAVTQTQTAPPPEAQATTNTTQAGNQTRPAPPPRVDIKSLDDVIRNLETTPPEQKPLPVIVKPDDIIRLIPLPDNQIQDIIKPVIADIQARVTSLPVTAQISLAHDLFANLSPRLTLPYADHAPLQHALPAQLPIISQNTDEPLQKPYLQTLPEAARPVVQNLIQSILQARSADSPSPFRPSPQGLSFVPDNGIKTANQLTQQSLNVNIRSVSISSATEGFSAFIDDSNLTNSSTLPSKGKAIFDARIENIFTPNIKILPVSDSKQTTKPQQTTITTPPDIGRLNISATASSSPLTGEVIGTTPQNLPVLSFALPGFDSLQNFALSFEAQNLQAGTQVTLRPLAPAIASQTAEPVISPFIPFDFFSNFQWPAMDELNQTLQQAAPQMAKAMLNTAPNPATPTRMPAAALFFIAAIRSGDISSWLGDKTIDALRQAGKGNLLNRLIRDIGGLQRTATEPGGQEWRALALPLTNENELSKMILYYRHDREQDHDGERDGKKSTRFIMDLNLDRMGAVQLDGLHRPQNEGGRLDLIVRTHNNFSAPMQQYMRRLYHEALQETSITGELSFQHNPDKFIKIEMPASPLSNQA